MTLADLIDLEVQLDADRALERATLRDRDAALTAQIDASSERDRLLQWIHALRRQPGNALPGQAIARGLRSAGWVVFAVAAVLGAGTAAGVLTFTGTHPANVLVAFAVLILLPLILFATQLAMTALSPQIADGPMAALTRRIGARLISLSGERSAALRQVLGQARARRSMYGRMESRWMWGVAQIPALGWCVGAVLTLLCLVTFTDLAFGWSTTLEVSDAGMQRFVDVVSAPWAWAAPSLRPDEAMVAATQYSRFDSAWVGDADVAARVTGRWWSFLAMSLLVWVLIPRLLAFAWSRIQMRRALARAPLDRPELLRVLRRLDPGRLTVGAAADGGDVRPLVDDGTQRPKPGFDVTAAQGLLWRDAPAGTPALRAWLLDELCLDIQAWHRAGGLDYEEELRTIAALKTTGAAPVVIVSEAHATPDRSLKRLLAALDGRRDAGRGTANDGAGAGHPTTSAGERHIYCVLWPPPTPEQKHIWGGYLREVGNPRLLFAAPEDEVHP